MNNYTSQVKSKKLVELGLDPESADMCWGLDAESGMYYNHPYPMPWKDYTAKEFYIPCWSVGALINLMPEQIEEVKDHKIDLWVSHRGVWYFDETGLQHGPTFTGELIDACYDMVVWLLRNNHLK